MEVLNKLITSTVSCLVVICRHFILFPVPTIDAIVGQDQLSKTYRLAAVRMEKLVQSRLEMFMKKTPTKVSSSSTASSTPTVGGGDRLINLITDSSWRNALDVELNKPYALEIEKFLAIQYAKNIFNAFNLTPIREIKVVIIGQDPYHNDGQAHGLCFSVAKGVHPPPSLKNIFNELSTDIPSFKTPSHGCLEAWARQGVFLLNATLTVEAHKANSHSSIGWQQFTDAVIKLINERCTNVVFLLWGGFAHRKEMLIDGKRHHIIKTAHPSPLSVRLFMSCKCFSKTNAALIKSGKTPIDWASL